MKTTEKETNDRIPHSVITRLPRYYRNLRELVGNDVLRVSSGELASIMGYSQSQIRKDFSFLTGLGRIGQQGYGYNVKDLYNILGEAIGIRENYSAVIVGDDMGICKTVASFPCFISRGVTLKKIFSCSGTDAADAEKHLRMVTDYIADNGITIAVLLCDQSSAAAISERLIESGIRGIWNMTGTDIPEHEGVCVIPFNPADALLQLCAEITNNK